MNKLTQFGKELRKLRIDYDETQTDVAKALGVSAVYLSSIETGKLNVTNELIGSVVEHYGLSEQHEQKLKVASEVSQKEVKINMSGLDDNQRILVASFARKVGTLNEDELKNMETLLGI